MASNLFGAGKPTADHSRAAFEQRQHAGRMQDANESAHPNKVTMLELIFRKGRSK